MAGTTLSQCGDPAVWRPVDGAAVQTVAVLRERSGTTGGFAHMPDPRPVIDLLRSVVGARAQGEVVVLDRTFELAEPVPASGDPSEFGDDGFVVQYYVRELRP